MHKNTGLIAIGSIQELSHCGIAIDVENCWKVWKFAFFYPTEVAV
jgi:hypothetical protein